MLRANQLRDLGNRVQVFRVDFVRLQGYRKPFLDEHDDLKRGDRIEHSSCNERRGVSELLRILARKEFLENEALDYALDVIGPASPRF